MDLPEKPQRTYPEAPKEALFGDPDWFQNVWFSNGFKTQTQNLSDVRTGRAFWFGEHEARLQLCCARVALIKLAHAHLGIVDMSKNRDQLV